MGLPEKWDTCSRTVSVSSDGYLAHWGNTIAVVSSSNSILLLDAITGRQMSALSGHTSCIWDLAFSVDGALLVSGSGDYTAKLWDIQTGGIIKSFQHSTDIFAASISPDGTTVFTGTWDGKVHLWDVWTEEYQSVRVHEKRVTAIRFSPINSQHLISSSFDGTVKQWDMDGSVIEIFHHEEDKVWDVAYVPDGTCFVVCGWTVVVVVSSESRAVMARFHAPMGIFYSCCFSPDGSCVACGAGNNIYIWNVTNSEVHPVGKLVGHSCGVCSIVFTSSSSLVSGSYDKSVRIWQCSSFLTDSTTPDSITASLTPAQVKSVNVSTKDGIIITSDSSGMVRTWDLTTCVCKSSFSTPAPAMGVHDTYLTGNALTIVWVEVITHRGKGDTYEYHIWDVGEDQLCRRLRSFNFSNIPDLRISGDGSRIFGIHPNAIECISMNTGERISTMEGLNQGSHLDGLTVHGSKVWFENSGDWGWDFGGQEVTTFSLSRELPDKPPLCLVYQSTQITSPLAWIKEIVAGRLVFRLPEKYTGPGTKKRFDGLYLSLIPPSGEAIVIDFSSVCSQ